MKNAPTVAHPRRQAASQRNWWAAPAACLSVLLALPVNAGITIPDDPLTTAARVAPNILFILDDSGSMAFNYMPDSVPSTSTPNVASLAYTRNTLSYNPATTYAPWVGADGNRMSGGTSYSAAYGSFNLVGGSTIDLGDASSCRRFNYNTNASTDELTGNSGTQVCGGVQTFYVPKDVSQTAESYLGNGRNYYRYQILTSGRVQRSEYGTVVRSSAQTVSVSSGSASGTLTSNSSVTLTLASVVADAVLNITINNTTSNNNRSLDYVIQDPSGTQVDSGTVSRNSSTISTVFPTASGQYRIVLARASNNNTSYSVTASRYTTNGCDSGASNNSSGWINCQYQTPTGRSELAERTNYATWFSYHRTRMKAAKAGSSEAFSALDGTVRVGFRTIWARGAEHATPIPVNDGNDGRFVDNTGSVSTTSRSTWYSRLFGTIGYNGTPLHGALDAAGRYFSSTAQTGPYGPQTGSDQYSCRQNFSILTTDGYWNNTSENYGTKVGHQDNQSGSQITGPNNQSYQYSPAAPYTDGFADTLADVAMKYWKTDLRTETYMTNNVPATSANPAFWQHMVTFGISIGLSGNKGWSSVADVPSNATWNDPTDTEDADRIDDLLHAAVNSRGTFVSATNPSEFTEGLSSALAAIAQRTSSYSNVATNSVSLDAGSQVFSASYVSGIWTGTVTARAVSSAGVSDAVSWTATTPAWGSRKIYTSSGSAVGVPGSSGTNFPTGVQETALTRTGGPANFEVTGDENARYIKGKAGLEARNGGTLRNRTSIIGDIVGSSPAYVKDSNTLFVGANDGMLHAFDAETGEELFAYVPNIINFSWLSTLSRGDYAHRFFVDGPIVVSSRKLTTDKNILVGTLGKGGKGVYALDVTDPRAEDISADSVFKWEVNETSGNHMGLVLGKPFFSRVQGGGTAVVFGNGINSTNERAVLIVLNAETGALIRAIDTGAGSAETPNGLSAATGVFGRDGKTLAYVYAGDMLGNVWKFDLTDSAPGNWTAKRMFTAANGDDVQPISGGVTVATHPRTGKRWIFFGTGRYLTTDDADANSAASAVVQSMYGIIENDDETEVERTELTQRNLTNSGATVDGYSVRTFDAKASLPEGSKGWYINLPETGERIVQDAQVVSTFLITASMVPTGSACEADGSGYINALDAFTGTSAGGSYFDLDGDGSTTDSTAGGLPVGSINVGVGMPTLPNLLRGLLIVGGTSGDTEDPLTLRPQWDRVSWREIRGD